LPSTGVTRWWPTPGYRVTPTGSFPMLELAVAAHELPHRLEPLRRHRDPVGLALERRPPVAPAGPAAEVVARHCARDSDQEGERQPERVPARQVAGGHQHGLLGHRRAEVPAVADEQNSDAAPQFAIRSPRLGAPRSLR